ncbi:MAG: UDP-glucose/GDP-mannose dehydrogenase family protein [Candidatus Omnitrophica bacterium]|nr:UDP-glucose/GDP-mannose dehydrogenase family protein [Candidatus Omnitrophota bacterium]
MKIGIIGSGYVGLVTGACFADLGNEVICMDSDKKKIELLKKGRVSFYEPGLEEMVVRNLREKRLSFTNQIKTVVKNSLVIFIAVGTPSKSGGEADLTFVENVAREIACNMRTYRIIVEKSTVPVETGKWIEHTIKVFNRGRVKFDIASNPEFLREGSAIQDFLHPDRIVIGVESRKAKEILSELYKPLKAPIIFTDINSAEMIKHAANSFLATKISFINAIANICEKTGADVLKVAEGMGLDKRIGRAFLDAGIGYGGSCFPKDVDAFIHIADKAGYEFELLKAVRKINENQKTLFLKKIKDALWVIQDKNIGILGLSFKPNTDDIRNAPSLEIISALLKEGANIRCFDPQAMPKVKEVLKDKIHFCRNSYEVARNADCLAIVTEWNEFKELDLLRLKRLMRQPIIIDGRNIYEPDKVKKLGFRYTGIGRGWF